MVSGFTLDTSLFRYSDLVDARKLRISEAKGFIFFYPIAELSLRFESPVASISTPVTTLLLCG